MEKVSLAIWDISWGGIVSPPHYVLYPLFKDNLSSFYSLFFYLKLGFCDVYKGDLYS